MKLKNFLANFFSAVFHPLWMPILGFVLAVYNDQYLVANKAIYQGIVGVLFVNMIVPLVMILIMIKLKMLSTIDLKHRKERLIPYLIVIGFYMYSYWLFQHQNLPISNLLYSYFLGIIIIMLAGVIINFIWKISVHLLAIGGVLGWLIALSILHQLNFDYLLITILFIAGLIAFARLYLKAHTPAQVYVGFILGLAMQLTVVYNHIFIHLY